MGCKKTAKYQLYANDFVGDYFGPEEGVDYHWRELCEFDHFLKPC